MKRDLSSMYRLSPKQGAVSTQVLADAVYNRDQLEILDRVTFTPAISLHLVKHVWPLQCRRVAIHQRQVSLSHKFSNVRGSNHNGRLDQRAFL